VRLRLTVLPVLAAASAAAVLAPGRRADAVTGTSGDLATGGIARADISRDAGDMDTITVTLETGETIGLSWNATFAANATFTDPTGAEVPFTLESQRMGKITDVVVAASGVYTFSIASADGSQGLYKLKVLPKWAKTLSFEGTAQTTFDVPMPAASMLRGVVIAAAGSSEPAILSFTSPTGSELLVAPIVGEGATVKMPPISCPDAGVYHLTVRANGGTGAYSVALKRRSSPLPKTQIDLRNGIDPISFANDGVEDYFNARCVSCHDWARTYVGVRAYSRQSLEKMKTGSMPRGGPRADAATLTLLSQWISSGYGK